MRTAYHMGAGPFLAAVCAGPVFAASAAFTAYLAAIPAATPVELSSVYIVPAIATFVFVPLFGTLLAIIPCLLGAAIVGGLGKHAPLFQQPFVWIVAGALTPAVIGLYAFLSLSGFDDVDFGLCLVMTITGAVCAGICRRSAVWSPVDPTVALESPVPTTPKSQAVARVSPPRPARSAPAPQNTGPRLQS